MTDADKPAFVQVIAKLAVALREPAPDVVLMQVYFVALKDIEIELVAAAAEHLILDAKWFPKTSEWRAAAKKIETDRRAALLDARRKSATRLCSRCDDTGWRPDERPPAKQLKMLRRNAHGEAELIDVPTPSEHMRPCECRQLRRDEILGRAPWPQLPAGNVPDGAIDRDVAVSLKADIEKRTGRVISPRGMPNTWTSRLARLADREEEA